MNIVIVIPSLLLFTMFLTHNAKSVGLSRLYVLQYDKNLKSTPMLSLGLRETTGIDAETPTGTVYILSYNRKNQASATVYLTVVVTFTVTCVEDESTGFPEVASAVLPRTSVCMC
jgi:hypothetical protein